MTEEKQDKAALIAAIRVDLHRLADILIDAQDVQAKLRAQLRELEKAVTDDTVAEKKKVTG